MRRLEGKVAIVTGANSGVGAAISRLFAAEGASVVMAARRKEALDEVANQINQAGGRTLAVPCDISKPEDPDRLVQAAIDAFGKVDVLVNNAGILESGLKPVDRFCDDDLDRIIETNQKGTMRCMRAATRHMVAGASIVNIASVAGEKGCGGAVYVSTKAAVIGVTKHTALRFQATGIRCNAICPGNTQTNIGVGMRQPSERGMAKATTGYAGATRSGTPEEISAAALFLASDQAGFINGETLTIDGGWSAY